MPSTNERQHLVEPGGAWWRQVQMFLDRKRAGDADRLAELQAEQARALGQIPTRIKPP
jgi:hypothetical protein